MNSGIYAPPTPQIHRSTLVITALKLRPLRCHPEPPTPRVWAVGWERQRTAKDRLQGRGCRGRFLHSL